MRIEEIPLGPAAAYYGLIFPVSAALRVDTGFNRAAADSSRIQC
jgi:hypothetical protein